MTIEEVFMYFGSGYRMKKSIGIHHSTMTNWRERGHIPIETQMRIEKLTGGKLKASLEHVNNVVTE